jgi:transposase
MRGNHSEQQEDMFSYVSLEDAVPLDHPIRKIKKLIDPILDELWPDFDGLYSSNGRPSIPPEQLLKSLLLQVLFTIRSERQLVEQLKYNLLYRWFVGLGITGQVWDRSTFSKNRERLVIGEIADRFFEQIINLAERKNLISKEHFSVDGTLVQAWASLKSFQKKEDGSKESDKSNDDDQVPKGRNLESDFKGEKRSNATHESKTDPEARLYTKLRAGTSQINYMGHVLMENRNGLAVDHRLTEPGYHEEPMAAFEMAQGLPDGGQKTLGSDKHYDQTYLTESLRGVGVVSHAAQNFHARKFTSSIDDRLAKQKGYEISRRKRKRVEEIFGWLKAIGLMRRPMTRGKAKMDWAFTFSLCVYNLVRIRGLCEV